MQLPHPVDALNDWLATQGCAPAEPAAGDAFRFDTPAGGSFALRELAGGRIEIFTSPGHVGEQALAALPDNALEDGDPLDEHGLFRLLSWDDEEAEWHFEVRPVDGLAVLACVADPPMALTDWGSRLAAFERACAEWGACLSSTQVALPDTALSDLSLAELLRI
jgi:hypothetical protein